MTVELSSIALGILIGVISAFLPHVARTAWERILDAIDRRRIQERRTRMRQAARQAAMAEACRYERHG